MANLPNPTKRSESLWIGHDWKYIKFPCRIKRLSSGRFQVG